MRDTILVLEDDDARFERLIRVLATQHPPAKCVRWRDAHAMIREMSAHLPTAALLCLDHDLYPPDRNAPDPGDGLDVARYLAAVPPCCPVLVHSSNSDRAQVMVGELEMSGWRCRRVAPIGHDWVEVDWAAAVRRLLGSGPSTHSNK